MCESPRQPLATSPSLERYSRQIVYEHLGSAAQRRLHAARAVLIGCGGLGTVLADLLVRAGVGYLRIVDRDFVELNNLQRQVLFTEQDVADLLPKAVAAGRRLAEINSEVVVEPIVTDVHAGNIETLIESADLILDGTDNLLTRFLINDAAVKHRVPWIYGACVAAEGMVLPILPGTTPCLRCIWDRPPPSGLTPSCNAVGILAPVVHHVAALQAMAALQMLTGQAAAVNRRLVRIDAWAGQFQQIDLQAAYDEGDCQCCKRGAYEYLLADRPHANVALLCGRDAMQISPAVEVSVDFEEIARQITPGAKAPPRFNRYLLRFEIDRHEITLFRDGRAIIKGTHSAEEARAIYATWVG